MQCLWARKVHAARKDIASVMAGVASVPEEAGSEKVTDIRTDPNSV
jgi:hypothetical protein